MLTTAPSQDRVNRETQRIYSAASSASFRRRGSASGAFLIAAFNVTTAVGRPPFMDEPTRIDVRAPLAGSRGARHPGDDRSFSFELFQRKGALLLVCDVSGFWRCLPRA